MKIKTGKKYLVVMVVEELGMVLIVFVPAMLPMVLLMHHIYRNLSMAAVWLRR